MNTAINLILEDVKNTKKHDRNGNPVYSVNVEALLNAGVDLAVIRQRVKSFGYRFVGKESKIRFQSYSLTQDLGNLING